MHTQVLHRLKPDKTIDKVMLRAKADGRRRVNFQGHGCQPVVVHVLNPSPQEADARQIFDF